MIIIKLTKSKFRALSSLSGNVTQLFVASWIIPPLTSKFDLSQLPVLILGLVLTIAGALVTLEFAQQGNL